jgi:hypothetical protein
LPFFRNNRDRVRPHQPATAVLGTGIRPQVASQLIREYIYLYGAVAPKDGTFVYLIMPTSNTACFQAFLDALSRRFARQQILLVLDGAPNHRSGRLAIGVTQIAHRLGVSPATLYRYIPPRAPRASPTTSRVEPCHSEEL